MGNSKSDIPDIPEEGLVQSPRKTIFKTISTQSTSSPLSGESFEISPKKIIEKSEGSSPSVDLDVRKADLKWVSKELSSDMAFCSKLNSVKATFPKSVYSIGEFVRESEYEDCFYNDTVPNVGPIKSKSTGNTYFGGILNGVPHGYGKFVSSDGTYIEGYFKNGFPDYKILRVCSSGEAYNGGWQDDKRHGHGTYLTAEGVITEADWSDDKVHGTCVITDKDGETTFRGRMVKNRKEGNCFFKDSKKNLIYKGDYRDGLFYGFGVLIYSEGVYHGTFKIGKKEGYGVLKTKDDKILKGMWISDDFISPTCQLDDRSTGYRHSSTDDDSSFDL